MTHHHSHYLQGGSLVSDIPLLSSWAGESRPVLISETDPFALDASDSAHLENIEALRGSSEEESSYTLSLTGRAELSLTPLVTESVVESGAELEDIESEISVVMDQTKLNTLSGMMSQIEDELDDLDPASITREEALQVETDLTRIWDMKNLFRNLVRELIAPLSSEDANKKLWENHSKEVVSKVIGHKKKVRAAVEILLPTERMTEFQRKTIELQQKSLDESLTARKQQEDTAKKSAWAEAKVRLQTFRDDYNSLVAEMNLDQTDWKDRDDPTISKNVQELKSWKKTYQAIVTNFREYERITEIHGEEDPTAEELSVARDEFTAVKDSFDSAKENIESADRVREIFSGQPRVGEKLDYPKFTGAAHEDYVKFHDKMVKAFRRNGVAKADQVDKLRTVLSGFALSLVPESTENIEKAFTTLKSAFGDPKKVLDDRMRKLKALGDLPPDKQANDKPGFRKQEEWYLNVEGLLSEIIELGGRHEDLAFHAFSEQTFNFLLSLFPCDMAAKLSEVTGSRKEQLVAVKEKLIIYRVRAQRLGKIYGDKAPPGPSASKHDGSKVQQGAGKAQSVNAGTFYKDPDINRDCRICKHLEQEGKPGVYEKHVSTYPTGCPLFAAMPTSQRRAIALKSNLCIRCLDPDVVWELPHIEECKAAKAKIRDYSCTNGKCRTHMWLCNYHRQDNMKAMEKHKFSLQKKGVTLALPSLVSHSSDISESAQYTPVLSIEEATRDLTRLERSNGNKHVKVAAPPMGQPLFLFFHVKGKTKGVNFFFDKGCSTACFREGVPGTELSGKILAKGPFQIGGVGGMQAKANDEWLVSVERTDGYRQFIKGLTVDHVTCDFPTINVEKAVAEVKRDKPGDAVLQQCKVPKQAGGVTDVLLGIHYSLIHPVPVHTLESGLTIYTTKLVGHGSGFNAMIGGPHSTFDCLSSQAGGAAQMVASFVLGLERYRAGEWSAPQIPHIQMCDDEMRFARELNATSSELPILAWLILLLWSPQRLNWHNPFSLRWIFWTEFKVIKKQMISLEQRVSVQ